jgi:outer membrane protein assembly factor BamB
VFAVSATSSDCWQYFQALDLATGEPCWSLTLGARDPALTAARDCVFVQTAPGRLSCLDLDGYALWKLDLGTLRHGPDASTAVLVAAVETPPALVAIDAPSGQVLWRRELRRPAKTPPAVRGRRVYFADESGIQVRSLIDGAEIGQMEADVSGPLYVAPDRFAFVSRSGELVLGDPAGGRETCRLAGAVPATNPLVGFNGVLFCTPSAIRAADLQGREVRSFVDVGPARITAAPVLHAGRVYIGIAGRGLVCVAGDEEP